MSLKILAVFILFIAEGFSIYMEIVGAKNYSTSPNSFWTVFFKLVPIIILAAALLLIGYMLGLKAFQNIWIVAALSIVFILILEPILAYSITGQLPTRGALAGMVLGAFGFFLSLFWK